MKKDHAHQIQEQNSPMPHKHEHNHSEPTGARPHPLTAFFGCCLGDEPTPISSKLQDLRVKIPETETEEVNFVPGELFTVTKDMVIGDIIANFPKTKAFVEDLHPLGLLSPTIYQTSIEMFFSDLPVNSDEICQQLTKIIND